MALFACNVCSRLQTSLGFARAQAIELISEYNVVMTDPPIQYLVADATGESVIVEFVDGEMKLHRNNMLQIITNFLVTGVDLSDESSCVRYDAVYSGLDSLKGDLSEFRFWSAGSFFPVEHNMVRCV